MIIHDDNADYYIFTICMCCFYLHKLRLRLDLRDMQQFQTLPGFRDFYPKDCFIRNYIFSKFRETATSYGFEEYDAPILEPTELFTTKSGNEIISQLFNFKDKGDRDISMRPEMTPSLVRMVCEHSNAMKKPIKWFNIGEAFRYERPQKGRLRSFYQFNVDMFGDKSPYADAEVIALAIGALTSFGLSDDDFHVRLSDRQLWSLFIKGCGIKDDQIPPILSVIDKIEKEVPNKIIEQLDNIIHGSGHEMFEKISTIKEIHSIKDAEEVFSKNTIISSNIIDRLQELDQLLNRLSAFGVSNYITIDFSIVRGLAYYTGFVFEIFEKFGEARALAGGGRYDDLSQKLGYEILPAVGFAIGDVTLGNLLQEKNLLPKFEKKVKYFMVYSDSTEKIALSTATHLRKKHALIFGEDECSSGNVKIKNMSNGTESITPISEFLQDLPYE